MISDQDIRLNGGHPVKTVRRLRAGNLSVMYEEGNLRYISSGRTEIIRMIYSAVRDRDWQNAETVLSDEVFDIHEDSFRITYNCRFLTEETDFLAGFTIEGNTDSSIVFSFEGESLKTFDKNRLGICVLHPVENCPGKPCHIVHADGSSESDSFPEAISPHQVFRDIRSMSWPVASGKCHIEFSGDVFETEDQRNWTDASFKTYSTPLSVPFPATVEKGTRISQKILFRAENISSKPVNDEEPVTVTINPEELLTFPSIGISQSGRKEPLTDGELRILRAIRPDHYRVDLHLSDDEWKTKADRAIIESSALSCKIEMALFFDDNYPVQADDVIKWIENAKPEVRVVHLFHCSEPVTPASMADKLIPMMRAAMPDTLVGIGTNANFVQLNRFSPGDHDNDLVTWSVHPQEHASDNRTLVENLAAQAETAKSALLFSGRRGLWISPVTIRRRFNANRLFYETQHNEPGVPPQVDRRQMSLFGACWTAGSLKYLLEAGVDGVTYFETTGERGIIQGEFGSSWPDYFKSVRGMVFPMYFVFKFLMRHKNLKVIRSTSSEPLHVENLALTDGRQVYMMLINFTGETRQVKLTGCTGMLRLKELSEKTFTSAVSSYLWTCEGNERVSNSGKQAFLEPYSVTFIEGWLKH